MVSSLSLSLSLSFCLSVWKVTDSLAYILNTAYISTPSVLTELQSP